MMQSRIEGHIAYLVVSYGESGGGGKGWAKKFHAVGWTICVEQEKSLVTIQAQYNVTGERNESIDPRW